MSVTETEPTITSIEVAEPNEAQRILLAARDLIADESRWCKEAFGEKDGPVCAVGAVWAAFGWPSLDPADDEYDLVAETVPGQALARAGHELHDCSCESPDIADVLNVNDRMGHATVMRMFNRAIELAGK